jgi:hypothetical protein
MHFPYESFTYINGSIKQLEGYLLQCKSFVHFGLGCSNRTQLALPSLTDAAFGLASSPAWYSLRQPNTWFAFTPCARATIATELPGTNVSSTMRRLSSALR